MGNTTNGAAGAELRSIVDRLENLIAEKKDLANDIRDVFDEAASRGYDKKVLRSVLKLRALAESERLAHEELRDLYLSRLGMRRSLRDPAEQQPFEETPLGGAGKPPPEPEIIRPERRGRTVAVTRPAASYDLAEDNEEELRQNYHSMNGRLAPPLKRLPGPSR